ncbi:hypothetical protein HDV01_002339 [Terramyces sp. JEL0728]|nr:hypothetical protein HDV01_002339 [Terramyces sp. JEL0728]
MGNAESQLTPPSSTKSIPVQIPSRENKTIISESPVAGSPLQIAGSIGSYTEKKLDIPPSPPRITRNDNFVQPAKEKPYRNSSKIIHQFGSLGLAPLQPMGTVKKNIPVMVVWSHTGQVVHLTGSFNNWKRKIRLSKSTEDFTTIVDMPPGKHSLKFIVDDEWKCSEDLPVEEDQDGNLVNYISVEDEEGRSVKDGLQDIADDFGMEKEIPDSPVESYLCNFPLMRSDKQPPSLPAQLQKVLLNSKSITQDDPYILPVPSHGQVQLFDFNFNVPLEFGIPMNNSKTVEMRPGYNYDPYHPTYLNVAMPEEVDPNYFSSRLYDAIQADMTCMNNISWSGEGKSNVSDFLQLEGNAQIHAQQVSVSIGLNHFVGFGKAPNLDSIFQMNDPIAIGEALMNQSIYPVIQFQNATNISGEFMGTVSSFLLSDWSFNGTFPDYRSELLRFYNGSLLFQDGAFNGSLGLDYTSVFRNCNFSGISKFEWKNNTQVYGDMVFASYEASFVAESVSLISRINSAYLSFNGNTTGKVDFHGMGGLFNVTSKSNFRVHTQPYDFMFYSKEFLFAIIPAVCLIGFVVYRVVKNKEKYFKIQSTANK